jgi:hypothetical protein
MEPLSEKDNLEDKGVAETIILKEALNKTGVRKCILDYFGSG